MNIIVIGSGVMGAGIAEQISNAGFKVYLLDIVIANQERNYLAKQAISKSSSLNPNNIIPGNLEDDLDIISNADWIIEVIVEKLDIKQNLYTKLEKYCKKECVISSNTSTIRLSQLIEKMGDEFKKNFFITHFFNPPRFMPLLEIVTSEFTKPEVVDEIAKFIDVHLGKTIIKSNDTPGFIANRIGCYWLEVSLSLAIEMGIAVEEADCLINKSIGIPKTGVFGLYDLIGLDVMRLISKSLISSLEKEDDFIKYSKDHNIVNKMIEDGLIGRKGKGGFYKLIKDAEGNKLKQVIDLSTGEYNDIKNINPSLLNIKELIEINKYALQVLSKTLSYSADLINQVSDSIYDIDQAMKLGYNWKFGPFELIDQIGAAHFKEKLIQQNIKIPEVINQIGDGKFYKENSYFTAKGYKQINRPEGIIYLNDFYNQVPICKNSSASVWNMGDGVAIIEFTSKMAVADQEVFTLIIEFFAKHADRFKAVVIANDQKNFSVGGNLKFMLDNSSNLALVENYLKLGQQAMMAIKYSNIPVIAGLKGMALGGGAEILLHSTAVVSHIETNSGLVEAGVGLIPGWGGCKEMIIRSNTKEELLGAFKIIMDGKISSSAYELKEMLKLDNFQISMNINRVISDCKNISSHKFTKFKRDRELLKIDWEEAILSYEGYDQVIARALAELFIINDSSEEELLEKERFVFLKLLSNKLTQDRIRYMLDHSKRLKN